MSRVREYAPAALVLVLGLVLWEAVVVAFSIEFYLLPAPHVIVASLQETYPVLVEAGLYTFTEAVLGYALGCGGGILAAMVASQSPAFAGLVLPSAVEPADDVHRAPRLRDPGDDRRGRERVLRWPGEIARRLHQEHRQPLPDPPGVVGDPGCVRLGIAVLLRGGAGRAAGHAVAL